MVTYTIVLTDEESQLLNGVARERGTTLEELIRDAVVALIDRYKAEENEVNL